MKKSWFQGILLLLLSCALFILSMLILDGVRLRGGAYRTGSIDSLKPVIYETIGRFNRIYSDFYATGGNPQLIDSFPASKMVRHRIFRDLGFLQRSGRVCVHDMTRMTILELSITAPDSAAALVSEEWVFAYQDLVTRKSLSEPKVLQFSYRYQLKKSGQDWSVVAWNPVFSPDTGLAAGDKSD